MKKKLIGVAVIAAIAVTAGWNFNQSKNEDDMSYLALANIEALTLTVKLSLVFLVHKYAKTAGAYILIHMRNFLVNRISNLILSRKVFFLST